MAGGKVPRRDAWGMRDGVGRELKCSGMQQSSTEAVDLKARLLIDESIPIIDAPGRSSERWSWGRGWGSHGENYGRAWPLRI